MKSSYYSHLLELFPCKARYIEWLKNGLDGRIYYYGEHFSSPVEGVPTMRLFRRRVSVLGKRLFASLKRESVCSDCILSEAYFSVNSELSELSGLNVCRFPWNSFIGVFGSSRCRETLTKINVAPYVSLLSDAFCESLEYLFETIRDYVSTHRIRLCVFPNDMTPINRIAIDACRAAGVPTAIFLHGLPGRYDTVDDNRADWLCVWGHKIAEQYVLQGVDPHKIIITGHPVYSTARFREPTEIDLTHPLVLTAAVCGAPSISDQYYLSDRGECVDYPWSVQVALKGVGICRAVLRPHPSENPQWYERYIDRTFYSVDRRTLSESLARSSVVIGPTSTVCLDAAFQGIPYFAYRTEMAFSVPSVPPFDNSESAFPVASTVPELISNLKSGRCMRPTVLKGYFAEQYGLEKLLQAANVYG